MEQTIFKDGDILLTYGKAGFWPPRRWILWLAYRGIKAYQKAKWGALGDYGATHVRIWTDGRFFEATTPRCKYTPLDELKLGKKKWKLCRWQDHDLLDGSRMGTLAARLDGSDYDEGDLLDFGISGFFGKFKKVVRIFGKREDKYRVCSTTAARILEWGGCTFPVPTNSVDPAYFANVHDWKVVAAHKP